MIRHTWKRIPKGERACVKKLHTHTHTHPSSCDEIIAQLGYSLITSVFHSVRACVCVRECLIKWHAFFNTWHLYSFWLLLAIFHHASETNHDYYNHLDYNYNWTGCRWLWLSFTFSLRFFLWIGCVALQPLDIIYICTFFLSFQLMQFNQRNDCEWGVTRYTRSNQLNT